MTNCDAKPTAGPTGLLKTSRTTFKSNWPPMLTVLMMIMVYMIAMNMSAKVRSAKTTFTSRDWWNCDLPLLILDVMFSTSTPMTWACRWRDFHWLHSMSSYPKVNDSLRTSKAQDLSLVSLKTSSTWVSTSQDSVSWKSSSILHLISFQNHP